jgi:hypothetical protein
MADLAWELAQYARLEPGGRDGVEAHLELTSGEEVIAAGATTNDALRNLADELQARDS